MCEITLHTGCQLDWTVVHIDWFNENNKKFNSRLEIVVLKDDAPRTIEIRLDDKVIATLTEDYYQE